MKITTLRSSPNDGAIYSSGFTSIPVGHRCGLFFLIGLYGYWWRSTERYLNNAFSRSLLYNSSNYGLPGHFNGVDKGTGYSVRSLKD